MVDWSPLSFAYREEATSTKLQQLQDNIVAHDHRADGTRGAAILPQWQDVASQVVMQAGWTLVAARRAVILGVGQIVDLRVTRTGAALVAGSTGNVADSRILTGWPDPPSNAGQLQFLNAGFGTLLDVQAFIESAGRITVSTAGAGGTIDNSQTLYVGGLAWFG